MAVTKGHGNPNWSRDEVILALDLYLQCQGNIPSPTDPRVIELSKVLNALPLHADARKNQAFRNPDGVGFKLQNIRQVATGKGLGNTSSVDRAVWADLGGYPQLVADIAARIRSSVGEVLPNPEEEETFREGRIITALHLRRERNPKLRKRVMDTAIKRGLSCEACGEGPKAKTPELATSSYEVHHKQPLALLADEGETKLSDAALLCASCHRTIHRMMHLKKGWVSIEHLKAEVRREGGPSPMAS